MQSLLFVKLDDIGSGQPTEDFVSIIRLSRPEFLKEVPVGEIFRISSSL